MQLQLTSYSSTETSKLCLSSSPVLGFQMVYSRAALFILSCAAAAHILQRHQNLEAMLSASTLPKIFSSISWVLQIPPRLRQPPPGQQPVASHHPVPVHRKHLTRIKSQSRMDAIKLSWSCVIHRSIKASRTVCERKDQHGLQAQQDDHQECDLQAA